MEIIKKYSPNFGSRNGVKITKVVIHIMAGTLKGTDSWFASPASGVSAHYGVGLKGEIHQYVNETDRAWHAGATNSESIGIEHEGYDLSKAPLEQLYASSQLLKEICARWSIPLDREHIIGHYQVKPEKPNCPATDKSIIDKLILMAKGNDKEKIKQEIIRLVNQL